MKTNTLLSTLPYDAAADDDVQPWTTTTKDDDDVAADDDDLHLDLDLDSHLRTWPPDCQSPRDLSGPGYC